MNKLLEIIPSSIKSYLSQIDRGELDNVEEIRFHLEGDISISTGKSKYIIHNMCNGDFLNGYFNKLLKYSYHSYEDSIKEGYITLENGIRVGICGKTVLGKDGITAMCDISSLNIRLGKEILGCSDFLMTDIIKGSYVANTLIISPPGCGKTTLIRDICRNLSNKGFQVGVCDERSEICAMNRGKSGYDIGPSTDVLDGCPKSIGMKMLLRAMSPRVIITDEIGKREDIESINECLLSGVSVITTIHGNSFSEVRQKPYICNLIEGGYFQVIITLSNNPKVGTVIEKHVT